MLVASLASDRNTRRRDIGRWFRLVVLRFYCCGVCLAAVGKLYSRRGVCCHLLHFGGPVVGVLRQGACNTQLVPLGCARAGQGQLG